MKPIYIILYAVIVTLLLTLVLPRLPRATPQARRGLWLAVLIGGIALLAVTALVLHP